jgi:hypothetical protein
MTHRRSWSYGFPAPPLSFHLAVWTSASSGDALTGRLPIQPCATRGLRFTLEDPISGPARCPDWSATTQPGLRSSSHGVLAPSTLPVWGIDFPVRASPRWSSPHRRSGVAGPVAFSSNLVAGFHTRFAPPSPFFTTLTVCSPPHPVMFFNHSRPWGCGPVFRSERVDP